MFIEKYLKNRKKEKEKENNYLIYSIELTDKQSFQVVLTFPMDGFMSNDSRFCTNRKAIQHFP